MEFKIYARDCLKLWTIRSKLNGKKSEDGRNASGEWESNGLMDLRFHCEHFKNIMGVNERVSSKDEKFGYCVNSHNSWWQGMILVIQTTMKCGRMSLEMMSCFEISQRSSPQKRPHGIKHFVSGTLLFRDYSKIWAWAWNWSLVSAVHKGIGGWSINCDETLMSLILTDMSLWRSVRHSSYFSCVLFLSRWWLPSLPSEKINPKRFF